MDADLVIASRNTLDGNLGFAEVGSHSAFDADLLTVGRIPCSGSTVAAEAHRRLKVPEKEHGGICEHV